MKIDEATRDVTAWLKCYYMRDRVGEVFMGSVAGVAAFGAFVALDNVYVEGLVQPTNRPEGGTTRPVDTRKLRGDARLVQMLRNAVESASGDDGWAHLGAVGSQIGNQASFDPRNHGYRKLSDLIEATGLFDVRREDQMIWVRDKRQA